ncbi:Zn-ribbon domain-containing OB-fold protein [Paenibacillus sp.]|uniref:Zn-ribbon domain-containing OB-fold protein n=1 Tax=Paenibacillus sp. TaxID=58172 RepID=UPI002D2E924B|nr:Zn-ribbon domain-containing OB-fold protein [Paenibacillus sp.]HZG83751.1 Zn-ribbon domain-containing OB-fold protein [Paenibacillus sp.]
MSEIASNAIPKPSPIRDVKSEPFFEGTAQGKLMIRRCPDCGGFAPPAEQYCTNCMTKLEWVQASGKATLFTWSVVQQVFHPAFADEVPYVIGVVKLEEGPRLYTRIVGVDVSALRLSMELEAKFEPWPNGEYLPVFTRK